MSAPTMRPGVVAPPAARVEAAQWERVAAQVAAGRSTVVVASADVRVPAAIREAAAQVTHVSPAAAIGAGAADGAEAVVLLDGVTAAALTEVRAWVRERVAAGARVLLRVDAAVAELLAPAVAEAVVLGQHTAEVSWLAAAGTTPGRVAVDLPATAPVQVLLLANAADALEAVGEPEAAASSAGAWTDGLRRANAQLRRANAQLRAERAPRESAAAAALQGRIGLLERRIAQLEEEARAAADRLAVEVEVARNNDDHFQQALTEIAWRDGEIARLHGVLQRPRHRVGAAIAWRIEQIPGATHLLRLAARLMRRG